jgi:TonB family protein
MNALIRNLYFSMVLFLLLPYSPAAQKSPVMVPPQASLDNPEFIKKLSLSEAQASTIKHGLEIREQEIIKMIAERRQNENQLVNLMGDDPINEEMIQKQIEVIAGLSAAIEKSSYSAMLFLRKNLTNDQYRQVEHFSPELTTKRTYEPDSRGIITPATIKQPKPISLPLPEYTNAARANRIEGIVVLQAVIHMDGTVTVKRVLRGLGYGLDEKAVDVVSKKWRYEPGTRNGEPVEVESHLEIWFRLH